MEQSTKVRHKILQDFQALSVNKDEKIDQRVVSNLDNYFLHVNKYVSSVIRSICSLISNLWLLYRFTLFSLGFQLLILAIVYDSFLFLITTDRFSFGLATLDSQVDNTKTQVRKTFNTLKKHHAIFHGQENKLDWYIASAQKTNRKLGLYARSKAMCQALILLLTKSTNRIVHPLAALFVIKRLNTSFPLASSMSVNQLKIDAGILLQLFQIFTKIWEDGALVKKNTELLSKITSNARNLKPLSRLIKNRQSTSRPYSIHRVILSTLESICVFSLCLLLLALIKPVFPMFIIDTTPFIPSIFRHVLYLHSSWTVVAFTLITSCYLFYFNYFRSKKNPYQNASTFLFPYLVATSTLFLQHLSGNMISILPCCSLVASIFLLDPYLPPARSLSLDKELKKPKKLEPIPSTMQSCSPRTFAYKTPSTGILLSAEEQYFKQCKTNHTLESDKNQDLLLSITLNPNDNPLSSLECTSSEQTLTHRKKTFALKTLQTLLYEYIIHDPGNLTDLDLDLLEAWPFFHDKMCDFLSDKKLAFDISGAGHLDTIKQQKIPQLSGGETVKLNLAILYAACHSPPGLKQRPISLLLNSCLTGFKDPDKHAILEKYLALPQQNHLFHFFYCQSGDLPDDLAFDKRLTIQDSPNPYQPSTKNRL